MDFSTLPSWAMPRSAVPIDQAWDGPRDTRWSVFKDFDCVCPSTLSPLASSTANTESGNRGDKGPLVFLMPGEAGMERLLRSCAHPSVSAMSPGVPRSLLLLKTRSWCPPRTELVTSLYSTISTLYVAADMALEVGGKVVVVTDNATGGAVELTRKEPCGVRESPSP